MRNIVSDLREALRQWRRTPAITVAALLSLTLGIGASTAIFSLINALLLKSLPVRNPQQIVTLRDSRSPAPFNLRISYPMFEVLSREVQSRTPEIAVRMALGAEPRRVRSLVLFRIFISLAAGVAAGITLSVAAEQLVRSLLHEVQPSDATQLALCTAIMLGVAIAAAAPPVRRATRVDPMTVLRSE